MSKTSWEFFAVKDASPSGFTWQWRKHGADGVTVSAAFSFYFDCLSDARANGYAGTPPGGPKAPVPRVPAVPNEA